MNESRERNEGDNNFDLEAAHHELKDAAGALLDRATTFFHHTKLDYHLPDGTTIKLFRQTNGEAVSEIVAIHEAPEYFEALGGKPVVTQRRIGVQLDRMPGYESVGEVEERIEQLSIDSDGRLRGEPELTEREMALQAANKPDDGLEDVTKSPYDAAHHQRFLDKIAAIEVRDTLRTPEELADEVYWMLDVLGQEKTVVKDYPRHLERRGHFVCNDTDTVLRQVYDADTGNVIYSALEVREAMPPHESAGVLWEVRTSFTSSANTDRIASQTWSVADMIGPDDKTVSQSSMMTPVEYGFNADMQVTNARNRLTYLQGHLE
jgi:hypothetical protein